MKKKNFLVKRLARNVQVMNQDLRREFGLNPSADREMTTLEKKVSPQLYGMLIQQLLGFHADMQLEMLSAHRQLDGVSFRGFHPGCVLHLDRHRARHPETRG